MALSGRTRRWNEINTKAANQISYSFDLNFSQAEILRVIFNQFLQASYESIYLLIYEGNPNKSRICVDIKNLKINSMINAHILGIQLYATMLSDLDPEILSLNSLHLFFAKIFPDHGVIQSVASCAKGRKEFNLSNYGTTYYNELADAVGALRPSFIDCIDSFLIVGSVFKNASKVLREKFNQME
jgi:hypothetical protein